ncbi:hypothetical protein CS022_02150 [Veronia nyctiphanis]|uniref:N-acetyltransferase domain-containing protein n=1 Tax=Veronia nyctiphanis TaxID=1278244 RepID=A0A4Q0YT93_9GAMM|nr:GNAT family N-acetyltransferase [Veronia nyctiphanis]RXJ74430.1 hypothetical protein CS022_02150 [Veronia nyctiphanis]
MITFEIAKERDKQWAFIIKANAEFHFIDKYFGWDEAFQHTLHDLEWKKTRPTLVLLNGKKVGFYSLEEEDDGLFFRRFFIEPELRRQGVGSQVMEHVKQSLPTGITELKLAIFHGNPAKRLYLRHGFVAYKSDEKFEYFVWDAQLV